MIRFEEYRLQSEVLILKSTIDPNGMPYKKMPDSSQMQQTQKFQYKAYCS